MYCPPLCSSENPFNHEWAEPQLSDDERLNLRRRLALIVGYDPSNHKIHVLGSGFIISLQPQFIVLTAAHVLIEFLNQVYGPAPRTALSEGGSDPIIDGQRLKYLQENINNLPSQSQALVGRLTALHEGQKAMIAELGRSRDLGAAYRSQLADITKSYDQEIAMAAENTTDPKTTMAWANLANRRSELEAELQNLLTQYKEKHPDVVAKKQQLESVKRDQDQMIAEWKTRIEERRQRLVQLTDPRILTLKTQITMVDSDMDRQQKLLNETNQQIADLDARINAIPNAEVGLEAIDREYQTKKLNYDNLLAQQQKIVVGADAAKDQQGGGIQVVDPANLPESPVAPKRLMLTVAGFGVGLALGLLLAVAVEMRRLFTIQTAEDAKHYTSLPLLASIPELMTPAEARAIPRRQKLAMAAGIAIAIFTVPALAFVLRLTHVFDKFLL